MTSAPTIHWDALVEAAKEARNNAHAPYSGFQVGAAVLSGSGQIYAGCNVENASYGLTICAERTAIGNMVSHGERNIRAIVVVTDAPEPTPPCGMCRQVLAEFADDIPVYLASTRKDVLPRTTSLAQLMPQAFRRNLLPSAPPPAGTAVK